MPGSMEDLKALSDQIVADGITPWCIGLGSGGATGWPATDWVEDLLLRTQTPDVYDGWVDNSIPFTDARIVAAIDEFGAFARTMPTSQVARARWHRPTSVTAPKACSHRRRNATCTGRPASFRAFFPEGTVVGEDADFFYFRLMRAKTSAIRFWVLAHFGRLPTIAKARMT